MMKRTTYALILLVFIQAFCFEIGHAASVQQIHEEMHTGPQPMHTKMSVTHRDSEDIMEENLITPLPIDSSNDDFIPGKPAFDLEDNNFADALPSNRRCGRERDAKQNAEHKMEVCALRLERATRALLLVLQREEEVEREFRQLMSATENRSRDVRRLRGSITAKRSQLRLPGGDTRQMRRMLSNLERRLANAERRLSESRNEQRNGRERLERIRREVSDERGNTNSVEATLEDVRQRVRITTSQYLECMGLGILE